LGSCIWLVAVRGARQLLGSTTCRRALVEPGLSPACRAALGTAPIGRPRHLRQAVPGCERVKRCSPGTARRRCHGRPVGAVPSAARQAGDNPGSAGGHADVLCSSTCVPCSHQLRLPNCNYPTSLTPQSRTPLPLAAARPTAGPWRWPARRRPVARWRAGTPPPARRVDGSSCVEGAAVLALSHAALAACRRASSAVAATQHGLPAEDAVLW